MDGDPNEKKQARADQGDSQTRVCPAGRVQGLEFKSPQKAGQLRPERNADSRLGQPGGGAPWFSEKPKAGIPMIGRGAGDVDKVCSDWATGRRK